MKWIIILFLIIVVVFCYKHYFRQSAFEKHMKTCPTCTQDKTGEFVELNPLCEEGFRLLQEELKK